MSVFESETCGRATVICENGVSQCSAGENGAGEAPIGHGGLSAAKDTGVVTTVSFVVDVGKVTAVLTPSGSDDGKLVDVTHLVGSSNISVWLLLCND